MLFLSKLKEDLNIIKKENKVMAVYICPVCKRRVTGEHSRPIYFNGRYYHPSCFENIRLQRFKSPFGRRKFF